MTDYIIEYETALAAGTIAAGDLLRVYDLSAKAYRSVTGADIRKLANAGLTAATAATLTVTEASHAGHTITLDRAAGIAVTLPAATGTGNKYTFIVITTVTSNSTTIKVADATDVFIGSASLCQDGGDTAVHFEAAATDDTVTFNGTTTGGLAGAIAEFQDVATNTWFVRVKSAATGTEATPFSATV
jgi:hypothetical protein